MNYEVPAYTTTALILKSLTKYLPCRIPSNHRWKHLEGLELADSEPMNNDSIDLIIGADLFGMLLCDGVQKGPRDEPVAQCTTLGWILSDLTSHQINNSLPSFHVHHGGILENLETSLRHFWEIEEIP